MSNTPLSIRPGETHKIRLPYSEVCMHMRVADQVWDVLLAERNGSYGAQLVRPDGSSFSAPITLGEAGIFESGSPFEPHFYHYGEG